MPTATTMNHDEEEPAPNAGAFAQSGTVPGLVKPSVNGPVHVHRGYDFLGEEFPAAGQPSGIGLPMDWGNNPQHGGYRGPL
jgi:hypothetical protein